MQLQAADYPAITRTVKPPQLCLTAACRVARVSDAKFSTRKGAVRFL